MRNKNAIISDLLAHESTKVLLVDGVNSKTIRIQMDENRKVIDHLEDQYKKLRFG